MGPRDQHPQPGAGLTLGRAEALFGSLVEGVHLHLIGSAIAAHHDRRRARIGDPWSAEVRASSDEAFGSDRRDKVPHQFGADFGDVIACRNKMCAGFWPQSGSGRRSRRPMTVTAWPRRPRVFFPDVITMKTI